MWRTACVMEIVAQEGPRECWQGGSGEVAGAKRASVAESGTCKAVTWTVVRAGHGMRVGGTVGEPGGLG